MPLKKFSKTHLFPATLLLGLIYISHRSWFSGANLIGGEWWPVPFSALIEYFSVPRAWNTQLDIGYPNLLQTTFYCFHLVYGACANFFGIGNLLPERILFFGVAAIMPAFSMYFLTWQLFKKPAVSFFAALLYTFNTYIMVIHQNHLMIACAYSLAPLVLAFYMRALEKNFLKNSLITGVLLALAMAYEPRITYIILWILFLYALLSILLNFGTRTTRSALAIKALGSFPIMLSIVFGLHAYWIFPFVFGEKAVLEAALQSRPWISWMTLLNALAFYTPFWTGAQPTEFVRVPVNLIYMVIPLLSFSAVLLRRSRITVIFALLALVFIFLVKQENAPFGFVYTFMFRYVPGFMLFREASKFCLGAGLFLSILFGVGIHETGNRIRGSRSVSPGISLAARNAFFFACTAFFIYSARPLITKEIGGVFVPRQIPADYVQLEEFINSQPDFFRTLWLPVRVALSPFSSRHPVVSGTSVGLGSFKPFWTENSGFYPHLSYIKHPSFEQLLKFACVKYVIVPFDNFNEIYRHYGDKNKYVSLLDSRPWLKKLSVTQNIVVYENKNYFPKIYASPSNFLIDAHPSCALTYSQLSPTRYVIDVSADKPFWLIFSEGHHPAWKAYVLSSGANASNRAAGPLRDSSIAAAVREKKFRHELVLHEKVRNLLNGWYVPVDSLSRDDIIHKNAVSKKYEFTVVLEFATQTLYEAGTLISLAALLVLGIVFLFMLAKSFVRPRLRNVPDKQAR